MVKDMDVVVSMAIRVLLFSAAFQHATALPQDNETKNDVLALSYAELSSKLTMLAAFLEQKRSERSLRGAMQKVELGKIARFEHEYLCKFVFDRGDFATNQATGSDLNFLVANFSELSPKNVRNVVINNRNYFVMFGANVLEKVQNKKFFWVFREEVEVICLRCVKFAKQSLSDSM